MPYGFPPGNPQALYDEDEFDQQGEFGGDPFAEELEALQQEEFQPGQFRGSAFERFAPLSNLDLPRPQSIGEGFFQGLAGTLGRQGTQAQQARQRFEQSEAERRKSFDVDRRAASRELRSLSGQGRRARLKEQADERKARKKYEDETHLLTDADIKEFPHLARVADSEGRVPKAWVKEATAPVKPGKTLADIEAEAEARARGGRRGAPPVATTQGRPSTGDEKKSLSFYNLAREAQDVMTGLDSSKINPAKVRAALQLPFGLGNALGLNEQEQIALQASRQFTQAKLRRESGATITPVEYATDFDTYMNAAGDLPGVTTRKSTARGTVIEGLKFQSGRAYGEYYGEDAPTGSARSRTKKPGARSPQERQDVKRSALDALRRGEDDGVDAYLQANPWLFDDPDFEAAMDAVGIPR